MNDKEKLISLLILTDPNPYTCESESGSCELTTCTECRARSTADLLIENGVTVQECKLGVKKTNADRIRSMSDEELATHLHDIGWDCHLCAEHGRLDNEPLLRGEKCDEKCVEHCLEWLQQPAEEVDNETVGERKDGDDNG